MKKLTFLVIQFLFINICFSQFTLDDIGVEIDNSSSISEIPNNFIPVGTAAYNFKTNLNNAISQLDFIQMNNNHIANPTAFVPCPCGYKLVDLTIDYNQFPSLLKNTIIDMDRTYSGGVTAEQQKQFLKDYMEIVKNYLSSIGYNFHDVHDLEILFTTASGSGSNPYRAYGIKIKIKQCAPCLS